MRALQLILILTLLPIVGSVECRRSVDKVANTKRQLKLICVQISIYEQAHGMPPRDIEELISFDPTVDLIDPWGNTIIYEQHGDSFTVTSTSGTVDDPADDIIMDGLPLG